MSHEQATQFPHGADIGVRGTGRTRAAAFAQVATALAAAVVDPATVIPSQGISIACEAPDDRLRLYDWLNAVIYEMAVRGMVFRRFEVSLQVVPHVSPVALHRNDGQPCPYPAFGIEQRRKFSQGHAVSQG
jgi:SHS2 domain-containing protein